MSAIEALEAQLKAVAGDVAALRSESRTNADTLASAIRRSRAQVVAQDLANSVRNGHPSISPILWASRAGNFVEPDLASSLIDRLQKGERVSDTMGPDLLGPPTSDFAIVYDGFDRVVTVTRTEFAVVSGLTTVTWVGAHVGSVVTTKFGRTITVTPTYSGDDVVAIHRVVT